MISWLKCCLEWWCWVGREHPVSGRFGPVHAWEMARCFYPTREEQERISRDVKEAILWAESVRERRRSS